MNTMTVVESRSTRQTKNLKVVLIDFDRKLKKEIESRLSDVSVVNWTISRWARESFDRSPWRSWEHLFAIYLKTNIGQDSFPETFNKLFVHLQCNAPALFIQREQSHLTKSLLQWYGARVFSGSSGASKLIQFLSETTHRDKSQTIMELRVSDSGLSTKFADGAEALVPLSDVRRLAESTDIVWSGIRIAPNRGYIEVPIGTSEDVPIPHDVLREFIKVERKARNVTQNRNARLTGEVLGSKVRSLRRNLGLTQEKLAAKAGTSRWTLHRVESGHYLPKVKLLENIARALGTDLQDILPR